MEKTVGHAWQLGLSDGDAHLGVTEDLIPPDQSDPQDPARD